MRSYISDYKTDFEALNLHNTPKSTTRNKLEKNYLTTLTNLVSTLKLLFFHLDSLLISGKPDYPVTSPFLLTTSLLTMTILGTFEWIFKQFWIKSRESNFSVSIAILDWAGKFKKNTNKILFFLKVYIDNPMCGIHIISQHFFSFESAKK